MKPATVLVCLTLSTGILPAQTPAKSGPPQKPGSVEGVVISSAGGQPVKKATVTLRSSALHVAYITTADAAGQFRFDNVEPGRYQLIAERQGFTIQMSRQGVRSMKLLTVSEEQHINDVQMQLLPLGTLSGRVLDPDGEPIAGAQVRAVRYLYDQPTKALHPTQFSITNDLGEYHLGDLVPARYYIQVTVLPRFLLPGRTRAAGVEETYPMTFYPAVRDLAQATPAEIAPGAPATGIDFRLEKTRAYHVRGKLVGGEPAEVLELIATGATISIDPPVVARVRQDGTFDFQGVASGSYIVTANQRSARQVVNVGDQDVEDVVLTTRPGVDVRGFVRADGSTPDQLRSVQMFLLPDVPRQRSAYGFVQTDGTFLLTNVAPSVYHLDLRLGSLAGRYLKSIRFREQEAPDGRLDLLHGSGILELAFGADGGQLLGSVRNEKGELASGVLVTVAPGDEYQERIDLFNYCRSGPNGSFSFEGLAPGDYKVFAWEDFAMNAVPAAELRKAFDSRAVSLSIKPGANEKVELNVISAEEIEAERRKLP